MVFPLIPLAAGLIEFAPQIAKLFGGDDAADQAQKVIDVAKQVTGLSDPGEAVSAIKADPALQLEFSREANTLERAYLEDRKDARARDVAMRAGGQHNYRADVLAFLACAGLIVCVWLVAKDAGLPERAVNAIMFVAGVFASAVRDVFAFEFGSSRSSRDKDEVIRGLRR